MPGAEMSRAAELGMIIFIVGGVLVLYYTSYYFTCMEKCKTEEDRKIARDARQKVRDDYTEKTRLADEARVAKVEKQGGETFTQKYIHRTKKFFQRLDRSKLMTLGLVFGQILVILQSAVEIPNYTKDYIYYGSCGTYSKGGFGDHKLNFPRPICPKFTYVGFCNSYDRDVTDDGQDEDSIYKYSVGSSNLCDFKAKAEQTYFVACSDGSSDNFGLPTRSPTPAPSSSRNRPTQAPTYNGDDCGAFPRSTIVQPDDCDATYGDLQDAIYNRYSAAAVTAIVSTFSSITMISIFLAYNAYYAYRNMLQKSIDDPKWRDPRPLWADTTHPDNTLINALAGVPVIGMTWAQIAEAQKPRAQKWFYWSCVAGYVQQWVLMAMSIKGIDDASNLGFTKTTLKETCPEFVTEAASVKTNIDILCGMTIVASSFSIMAQILAFYSGDWVDEFTFKEQYVTEALKGYLKLYVEDALGSLVSGMKVIEEVTNVVGENNESFKAAITAASEKATDAAVEKASDKIVDKVVASESSEVENKL